MRLFPRTLPGILKTFTKIEKELEDYIADRKAAASNNDTLIEAHLLGISNLNEANDALHADSVAANEVLQNIKGIVAPAHTTTEV
ncbi:hypothetical protein [Pyruvatibacter sp.]